MIQVERLVFSYTGSAPFILNGLDLTVHEGEYISVVGDNGSGKSTLIRLLLGFLKPTKGKIRGLPARIGYLPQKKDAADNSFPVTVSEVLCSYARLMHIDCKQSEELLALLDILPLKNQLMSFLSGGQAQKVLLARALLGNPRLVILDEPSTGIDRESQREIYDLINSLNRERGTTILSVEHNLEAAMSNSSQIFHLANGVGHLCTPERYRDEFLAYL